MLKRSIFLSQLRTMFFSSSSLLSSPPVKSEWDELKISNGRELSEEDKMQIALGDCDPTTPEMAYYHALGCLNLGHYDEAVFFFKKSMVLDPNYSEKAKHEISVIDATSLVNIGKPQ